MLEKYTKTQLRTLVSRLDTQLSPIMRARRIAIDAINKEMAK